MSVAEQVIFNLLLVALMTRIAGWLAQNHTKKFDKVVIFLATWKWEKEG